MMKRMLGRLSADAGAAPAAIARGTSNSTNVTRSVFQSEERGFMVSRWTLNRLPAMRAVESFVAQFRWPKFCVVFHGLHVSLRLPHAPAHSVNSPAAYPRAACLRTTRFRGGRLIRTSPEHRPDHLR